MKLSEYEKSALQEAGNIGSGHAAIALSQMMGRKIMIAIPSVSVVDLSELDKILDREGEDYVLVSLSVMGDVEGMIVFTLGHAMALSLCDIVMGQEMGSTKNITEVEESALKEIGNIISASYLNAFGEVAKMSVVVSVPDFARGSLRMISEIIAEKNIDIEDVKKIFCIRTEFIEASNKIDGYLIFVASDDDMNKIIKGLSS